VRDATRAREAALWFHDRGEELLVPVERAVAAGAAFAAPGVVARVDEHPYVWALNEKQPVHLQKGKKPLPREFAAEMLLLPLDDTGGLLVLSFDEPVPGGAEAVALACSRLLAGLGGILPATDQPTHEVRDALTGLATPEAFEAHLEGLAAHFRRYQRPFALVVLDIDHFKATNDRWGHGAGDRLLQHIAMLLRGSLRETDYAGRIGGEEFGVLLPETELDEALALAERVRMTVVENPLAWSGSRIAATASFGVATCPGSTVLPTEVPAEAEAALLRAKRGGRNRVAAAGQDA
jgi:diguanylate cyclase (GGDEF)-like protein